ncbi:MAG: DnaJ domain-containing protein [Myxococcales bacterium]|nr:DnaJ domain-containing protein [Myxococcales bacterium]
MQGSSVLTRVDCDLRKLPLEAREAFLLSQLDGRLTLEEIGEIASIPLGDALAMASRLVDLGAASASGRRSRVPPRADRRSLRPARHDPRSERVSLRPGSRPDPRAEEDHHARPRPGPGPARVSRPPPRSSRRPPEPPRSSRRPPEPLRGNAASASEDKPRRSRKSLRSQRAAEVPPAKTRAVDDDVCELSEAVQATILELDATLPARDLYQRLSLERGADKKAVKRAYFGFVAKYHPDRFFGKKLGKLRAAIDRVFRLVTDAHDTLVDAALRAKYDATLPPAPETTARRSKAPPAHKASVPPRTPSLPPRKPSKAAMRRLSRKMNVVKGPSSPPAAAIIHAPAVDPPPIVVSLAPPAIAPPTDDRLRRLIANARDATARSRIEMMVRAADEAAAAGDLIAAERNYRLALGHEEDPYVRSKLEAIETEARKLRFERSMSVARAAERDRQWADAAVHYEKAFLARPDAGAAERAAYSLHLSSGDLERALQLAERAVLMRHTNAAYRITLAAILVAKGDLERAQDEVETALELAPKDASVKESARAILVSVKKRSRD